MKVRFCFSFNNGGSAPLLDKKIIHGHFTVFQTSRADMDWYIERSGSNVENVMDECCIRLRGLPYGCTKEDIIKFFSGMYYV